MKYNEEPNIETFWAIEQLPNYKFDEYTARIIVVDLIHGGMSEITIRKMYAVSPSPLDVNVEKEEEKTDDTESELEVEMDCS